MLDKEAVKQAIRSGESFNSIAIRMGCSREYIGQINAAMTGSRNGVIRMRSRQVARRPLRFLEKVPDWFRDLRCTLLSKGFRVELDKAESYGSKGSPNYYQRFMIVNGIRCKILRALTPSNPNGSRIGYYRMSTVGSVLPDIYLFLTPAGTFVIPVPIPTKQVFIPVEKVSTYHNIYPTIDWWAYHEAWDLLRSKRS